MGMFPAPKLTAGANVPPGSKVNFCVRYRAGKKPFETLQEAKDFTKAERLKPEGWGEITRVVSTIVEPR